MKEMYYTCTGQKKFPLLPKITCNTPNTNMWATEHVNYIGVDQSKQLLGHDRSHKKSQNTKVFTKAFALTLLIAMPNWKLSGGNYQHTDRKCNLCYANIFSQLP